MDPNRIGVYPGLQYKKAGVSDTANAVTDSLKNVTKYDQGTPGPLTVWRDADGNNWVMNGHHRRELAIRTGEPDVPVRVFDENDGVDFNKARALGAIQNIKDDNGTALDAATVLRDLNANPEQLQSWGVNLKKGLGRDATSLLKLSPDSLSLVENGQVPEPVAASVAEAGLDPRRELATMKEAARGELKTRDQGSALAALARSAPMIDRTGGTGDLFGEFDDQLSLAEQSKIAEAVARRLSQNQRLYEAVAKGRAAGETNVDTEAQMNAAAVQEFARKVIATDPETARLLEEEANGYAQQPTRARLDSAIGAVAARAQTAAEGRVAELRRLGTDTANGVPGERAAPNTVGAERNPVAGGGAEGTEGGVAKQPIAPLVPANELFNEPEPLELTPTEAKPKAAPKEPKLAAIQGVLSPEEIGDKTGQLGFGIPEGIQEAHAGLPVGKLMERAFNTDANGNKIFPSLVDRARNTLANLSTLRRVSPEAAMAAARLGGSPAEAGVLMRKGIPAINRAAGEPDFFAQMRPALVESRLIGAEQRWGQLARTMRSVPDADAEQEVISVLPLAERLGIGTQVGHALTVDPTVARDMMADAFEGAAGSVTHIMPRAQFDAITKDAAFQRGLAVYKEHFEKPLSESHAENEGVFSDALGPLDTYYPLSPLDEAGKPLQHGPTPNAPIQFGRRPEMQRPGNPRNNFATGLSPNYATDVQSLGDAVSRAFYTNNRGLLIDTLKDAGLVKAADKATTEAVRGGEPFILDGQPNRARVVSVGPGKEAIMPDWLAAELEPVLGKKGDLDTSNIPKVVDAINTFGMAGPMLARMHGQNIVGALISETPYLGESLAAKGVSMLPFAKRLAANVALLRTDTGSEAALRDFQTMAKEGALPSKEFSATYSKDLAEQTGAKKVTPFSLQPYLYGPNGLDARARLLMFRSATDMGLTGQARADFVNRLGAYNKALKGSIERTFGGSGVSPFVTAGKTMVGNGIRAWTLGGAMPESSAPMAQRIAYRAAQQVSGGAVGFLTTWAVLNHALNGEWPWEDRRSRLGEIRIPDEVADRFPMIARDGNGARYIGLGFANPLAQRGASAFGLRAGYDTAQAGYDTAQAGGLPSQVAESMAAQSLDTLGHPLVSGPAFQGASALAGYEPYVTGFHDKEGRRGIQLMPATPDVGDFGGQAWVNAKTAALRTNSLLAGAGEGIGLTEPAFTPGDDQRTTGQKMLDGVLGFALPGLLSPGYNADYRRKLTQEQLRGEMRTEMRRGNR